MATSIPSVDVPAGFTPPALPSLGGAISDSLPSLPALSNYLTGANQGVGTTNATDTGSTANGLTNTQIANNQATGGTGNPAVPVAGTGVLAQLGAWLKSIALPGTVALIALLLVIFSVYRAVQNHQ
jgi:hypothetical protein